MKQVQRWSGWIVAGIFGILLVAVAMEKPKSSPAAVDPKIALQIPATSPSGQLTSEEKRRIQLLQDDAAKELKFQESPWRLGRYPAVAPFEAVRWNDGLPEVRVNNTWLALLSLNDLKTSEIIAMCKSQDAKEWQKRFEDDLVAVLSQSGHTPGQTVTLGVKDLGTGSERTLKDVPMTEANRTSVHDFRAERLIMGK